MKKCVHLFSRGELLSHFEYSGKCLTVFLGIWRIWCTYEKDTIQEDLKMEISGDDKQHVAIQKK